MANKNLLKTECIILYIIKIPLKTEISYKCRVNCIDFSLHTMVDVDMHINFFAKLF